VLVATPYHVIPSFEVATEYEFPCPTAIHRFPSQQTPRPFENILMLVDIPVQLIPSYE
jgi:hypothetical protein